MQMSSSARLMDVMSRPVQVATPGQRLAEVDAIFTAQHSGLPVVDDESRCIGVVSNKDQAKATNGVESNSHTPLSFS
jgi:CBS domain-containing protein